MPTLSVTKTYQDGDILTEADLDNIRESIQTFVNTTKLDDDNIQNNGISAAKLGIDDGEFIEFGTGNDGAIGVTSDDLYIKNVTTDKDIIFQGSPGGVLTEIFRLDASAQTLVMNSKKITGLANADTSVDGEAVNVATLKTFMPAGAIIAYSGTSAPSGFLLCDGSAVSRTTYATLFAVIGEAAGEGDNSTTFNLPDLRGRFLRGRDAGAGRDPDAGSRTAMNTGGNVGDQLFSVQDDMVKAHDHDANRGSEITSPSGNGYARSAITGTDSGVMIESTGTTMGNETRPKNANVTYIIKT